MDPNRVPSPISDHSFAPSTQGAPVRVVSARDLACIQNELHGLIARRAYELFERRGHTHGRALEDWLQAELEFVYPCGHCVTEIRDALIVHEELMGPFTADKILVGIEPRKVIVSGQMEVHMTCGDARGTHPERRTQRIFRQEALPIEVNPAGAMASLMGETLEIVIRKAA